MRHDMVKYRAWDIEVVGNVYENPELVKQEK